MLAGVDGFSELFDVPPPAPDFARRVEAQAALYFDDILPRCIDAWFAGRGYRLIAEMMRLHDADSVAAALALPAPSEKARRMAARARESCPLFAVDELMFQDGMPVLGQYLHRSLIQGHFLGVSFQVLEEHHWVVLYGGCFAPMPEARLDHEILLTIFHEYIHYFESFLPAKEQPLRSRERGTRHRLYAPDEAAHRDRRYTVGGGACSSACRRWPSCWAWP